MTLLGSDISHYRLMLDWDQYLASGRSFLAFKATDWKNDAWFVDPTLDDNLAGCKSRGLHAVAYHFLRPQRSGVDQANFFLSKVPAQGVILAVDFEPVVGQSPQPSLVQLEEFTDRVRTVTGRWPWVYSSRGGWNALTGGARGPTMCPLWHAEWASSVGSMYGDWTWPVMWQYTSTASVPGISAPNDDNRFLGTELDLLRHAWGTTNVSAEDRGWGPPCPTSRIVSISAGGRTFNVHARVAPIFKAFVEELVRRGYPINQGTLDDWSYVCRHIANDPNRPWSNHAWGLAIDINSLANPMKLPLTTNMPAWVRNADDLMRRYGLRWGGTYTGTPDPMHFEFMLTPTDADRIAARLQEDDVTETEFKTWLAEAFGQFGGPTREALKATSLWGAREALNEHPFPTAAEIASAVAPLVPGGASLADIEARIKAVIDGTTLPTS